MTLSRFGFIGDKRYNFVKHRQLSTRQWRAWRRLYWLGVMFHNRVHAIKVGSEQHDLMQTINDRLRRMKWTTNELLLDMLQQIKGNSCETMLDETHSEITKRIFLGKG